MVAIIFGLDVVNHSRVVVCITVFVVVIVIIIVVVVVGWRWCCCCCCSGCCGAFVFSRHGHGCSSVGFVVFLFSEI